MAHSFWVICRNVSCTFVELCMETPYWCTVLVTARNQQKHLEFTFSIKALSFTQELAYMHINIFSNTWNGFTAVNWEERLFSMRQLSCFSNGVTHGENSEVQIVVWNMLVPTMNGVWMCMPSEHCRGPVSKHEFSSSTWFRGNRSSLRNIKWWNWNAFQSRLFYGSDRKY